MDTKEINSFDILIKFIEASKNNKDIETHFNGKIYSINPNKNYLLSQILRQYRIPKNHIFVSKKAKKLWHELTLNKCDIKDNSYRERIEYIGEKNEYIFYPYKGANRSPDNNKKIVLKKNSKFYFNDIFHFDHIIPISVIINNLKEAHPLTYEQIAEILDNIYACIMLKEEDRNIKKRFKREYDVIRVVENDYRNTKDNIPIEIDNWDSIKKSIEKKR